MRRTSKAIAFVTALTIGLSGQAPAEVVDFRAVVNAAPTIDIVIGERLEAVRDRTYPLHMRLQVPDMAAVGGDVSLGSVFPSGEEGFVAEFAYHVGSERLLEYAALSFASIRDGAPEDRMRYIYEVIEQQVYPTFLPPADADVLGGRIVSIGPYPAVEFISIYTTPEGVLTAARIVGVVPPAGPEVLIYLQRSALDRLAIADVNELSETFAGRILGSLTFVARRDATGALVPF